MTQTVVSPSSWVLFPQPVLSSELKKILDDLLEQLNKHLQFDQIKTKEKLHEVLRLLPYVSCQLSSEDAGIASVLFITFEFPSLETEHFVYELFDRFVASKCQCNELSSKGYTFELAIKNMPRLYVSEYLIQLSEKQSFERFKEKVMALKEQFRLAHLSKDFSFRLALSHQSRLDRKVTAIQRELIRLINENSEEIDYQFFLDSDQWLLTFPSDFVEKRSAELLSKVLFALVTTRKDLEWRETIDSSKRNVELHVFSSSLSFTFGTKPIISCVIGLEIDLNCERFTEKHLKAALSAILPHADLAIPPFFRKKESNVLMIYVEFEKQDGMRFSDNEINQLTTQLPTEIEARVQSIVPELFMIRNEEEIMKNILILTQEIESKQDLPQVMVRYEQHDEESLVFCVIVVRVVNKETVPIAEAFQQLEHSFTFIPERTQIVNQLKEDQPIEANVFRIQLSDLNLFMRRNFSFNFFEARHFIITMLEEALGEIRDFNGGMILKQNENLDRFKRSYNQLNSDHAELLEKFFYSINPIELQATVEIQMLKTFFETFSRLLDHKHTDFFSYQLVDKNGCLFLFTKRNDHASKQTFEKELEQEKFKNNLVLSSAILHHGFHYEGAVFKKEKDLDKQIELTLKKYLQHQIRPKIFTMNLEAKVNLDPRIGGDHHSSIIVKMLFEGLMRLDSKGVPQPAVAERVDISEDQTRYLFTLRKTFWSNGMKVLAEDFEYAWKKVLSPGFNTRFAYLFYPIKNARLAKEGQTSIDEVGVKAIDDHLLQVDLQNPSPFFLESTALGLYSPVNSYIDRIHPNWAQERNDRFVCNGPFRLHENRSFYTYELVKNMTYWNRDQIKLDYIFLSYANPRKAVEMFQNKKLDWLGPPVGPNRESYMKMREKIYYLASFKALWFIFNNQVFPFNNLKIRKAFSLAIDRKKITEYSRRKLQPSCSVLPPYHTELFENYQGLTEDSQEAYKLFCQGLKELKIKEEEFPQVTIMHYNSELSDQCSFLLKQQWEEVFGISCRIEPFEFSDLFERLGRGQFQVSCFSWSSWINDPSYTLNIFRNKEEKLNFFFWEDKAYKKLLRLADQELDQQKRLEYLQEAEKIFREQYLILPIFSEHEAYIKRDNFNVPVIDSLGLADFAYGYFKI